ncbi:hypothetical protein LTR85_007087 [Meristemomyces frigidus]|nr:hypothetical protein LTR85_007087 [Meristemomyces frigidus]
MDDTVEQIDLTSDDNTSSFLPRSTTSSNRTPISTPNPSSAYKGFYKGSSTQSHMASFGLAEGRVFKRRRITPDSLDDDWLNINAASPNAEPRKQPRLSNIQPSTEFRTPRDLSRAPELTPPGETDQYGLTPIISPTAAKRKRSDQISNLRTPSRASTFHSEDTRNSLGRKRSLIATPPSSSCSGNRTRIPDSPTPSFSNMPQDDANLADTLNTLASTITNLHKQYQQPMMDLARKVNALSDRLAEAEAENVRLSAHVDNSFTSFAQQTSKRMRDLEEKCQETIDAADIQMSTHRPVAGGAYGGPASTQPNRQPGAFADMLPSDATPGPRT